MNWGRPPSALCSQCLIVCRFIFREELPLPHICHFFSKPLGWLCLQIQYLPKKNNISPNHLTKYLPQKPKYFIWASDFVTVLARVGPKYSLQRQIFILTHLVLLLLTKAIVVAAKVNCIGYPPGYEIHTHMYRFSMDTVNKFENSEGKLFHSTVYNIGIFDIMGI